MCVCVCEGVCVCGCVGVLGCVCVIIQYTCLMISCVQEGQQQAYQHQDEEGHNDFISHGPGSITSYCAAFVWASYDCASNCQVSEASRSALFQTRAQS